VLRRLFVGVGHSVLHIGEAGLYFSKTWHLDAQQTGAARVPNNTKKDLANMYKNYAVIFTLLVFLSSCVMTPQPLTEEKSDLTQGNVQMNLIVGQTSKADVLENFGSPNITTRDGAGREVWSYQRAAQVTQSSKQSGYWTVILAGQSSSAAGFETSSRMITLIIKFNAQDIVADFRSRTSNF